MIAQWMKGIADKSVIPEFQMVEVDNDSQKLSSVAINCPYCLREST